MRRKWVFWVGGAAAALLVALIVAGYVLARRFEPYIREQTIAYLEERFDSEVEFAGLSVSVPFRAVVNVLVLPKRDAAVRARGEGLILRYRGRRDIPPMFAMRAFEFEVDLHSLRGRPARVNYVRLDGMEIHIPPKGERPRLHLGGELGPPDAKPPVIIDHLQADGTKLVILPHDPEKAPLVWDIHKLTMRSAGPGQSMPYDATLTNGRPPGHIISNGRFGPWVTGDPGAAPLDGVYSFTEADLGVFKGIAGTLESEGKFAGQLNRVLVDGWTKTPNFRLTSAGNRIPLETKFHAIVDGTNGDTLLKPVEATVRRTRFVAGGGVVRTRDERGRKVFFDVKLVDGNIEDLIRLAVKGDRPFLRGAIDLNMKMEVPPGRGEIADRLRLDGRFALENAHFTSPVVQEKIDDLSRRGQGRPKARDIQKVESSLAGRFRIAGGVIHLNDLRFTVPGAAVELNGDYRFDDEEMDFRGQLRLDAKVSQTMSGWKRWVLKPADPFFSKEGAGTLLNIKVTGTRDAPEFGRDR
jgi:hypothetical protein